MVRIIMVRKTCSKRKLMCRKFSGESTAIIIMYLVPKDKFTAAIIILSCGPNSWFCLTGMLDIVNELVATIDCWVCSRMKVADQCIAIGYYHTICNANTPTL